MSKRNATARAAKSRKQTGKTIFQKMSSVCGMPAGWLEIGFRGMCLAMSVAIGLILWFQVSTYGMHRQLTRDQLSLSKSFRELVVQHETEFRKLSTRIGDVENDVLEKFRNGTEIADTSRQEISTQVGKLTHGLDSITWAISNIDGELDAIQSRIDAVNKKLRSQDDNTDAMWTDMQANQVEMAKSLRAEFEEVLEYRCRYGAWLDAKHIEDAPFYSLDTIFARERFVSIAPTEGVTVGYGDCGTKYLFAPWADTDHEVLGNRIQRFADDIQAVLVRITPAGPVVQNVSGK